MRNPRLRSLIVIAAIALAAVPVARPSEQVAVNATGISLAVNGKGEALVTYTAGGTKKHLLVWGAVNAKPPKKGGQQVAFKLDYSGGYGKYDEEKYWKTFGGTCQPYKGPALAWLVKVCKAPDGSYWALQQWQRELKNYGEPSTGENAAQELRDLGIGPAARRSSRSLRTYPTRDSTTCSAPSSTPAKASTAFPRRQRVSRRTALGATSTSTRSTRHTARVGSARTAFSRTRQTGASATCSRSTGSIRPATVRSTAPR